MLLFAAHNLPRSRPGHRLINSLAPVLAVILLLAVNAPAHADGTLNILFVSAQTSAPYLQFIERTRLALSAGNRLTINVTSLRADELAGREQPLDGGAYDLVVALGTQAAQALHGWQAQAPVLYTLIPQGTYTGLKQSGHLACPRDQCTAVYIDQPPERFFQVLDAAFAGERRLGILLGPTSMQQREVLAALAAKYGFTLHSTVISEQGELLPALNDILKHADALLSIPDPTVYNPRTAKSVLLSTYRYKVPVLAYSKAYADAGATLSVYSTPDQIARQAARIITEFVRDRRSGLPPPQYPQHYKIRINQHVADSLGLDLENNPELRSIMKDADDE
jgi:ABC-type uncharacterized transport system substrate-binding protein